MADDSSRVLQFEVRDYFEVIRRRKWTVLCAVVLVGALGVLLSVREQNVYRSSADILIDPDPSLPASAVNMKPDLETEVRLLESQAVRELATKETPQLGRVLGKPSGPRVMQVAVDHTSPRLAMNSVEAYVKAYTDYRHEQMLSRLLAAADETQARIDSLASEVTKLNKELDEQLEQVQRKYGPVATESPTAAARRAQDLSREQAAVEDSIKPRRDSFQRQQILLEQTLQDLQVKSQRATQSLRVITPAGLPTSPIRPQPLQDGLKAVSMGLVLGILFAFAFEYLDDAINTREDLERAVGDVPVVGSIPNNEWKDASRPEIVTLISPRSPAAEAYRSLRTTVTFLGLDAPFGSLAITSAVSGEGKTTTLANLGVVMVGAGKRVVVLDADLRRPRIHSFFGLSNEVGFTSVLIGDVPLSAALRKVPVDGELYVLPSGPVPPNPSELLSSRRFSELIRSLRADDTLVLIDTPPLLPVTDAAVIAGSVDQLLLVTSVGRSKKKQLRHVVQTLRQVDAPLSGVVLNRLNADREGYYHYYYGSSERRPGRVAGRNGAGHDDGPIYTPNGNGAKAHRQKVSDRRR